MTSAADHSDTVGQRLDVERLLRTLTASQRIAVVLRYYLDVNDHDIAAERGVRESTVRSILARSLRSLRNSETLLR